MSTPQPDLGTLLTAGPAALAPSALPLPDGTTAKAPIIDIVTQGSSTTGSEHAEFHEGSDDDAATGAAAAAVTATREQKEKTQREAEESHKLKEEETRLAAGAGADTPGESAQKAEEIPGGISVSPAVIAAEEGKKQAEREEQHAKAELIARETSRVADQARKQATAATRKATSSRRKEQEAAKHLESELTEVAQAENRLINTRARLPKAAQGAANATNRATRDRALASDLETTAKLKEEEAVAARKRANELKEEAKKAGSMKYKWKPYIIAGVVVGVGVLVAAGVAAVCIFAPGTLSVAGLAAANITTAAVAWTASHLVSAFTTAAAFVVNHIMPALANFFFQIGAGLLRAIGISASSHFAASVVAGLATVAAVPAALVTTTFFAYRKGRNEDCEPPVVLSSDADCDATRASASLCRSAPSE